MTQLIRTNATNTVNTAPTMSSLEIAKLTGKQHNNVMADIKKVLDQVGIGGLTFQSSYLSPQNKELPCYNLPRRECYLVMSGYSAPYRLAIIDRWQELEQSSSPDANPLLVYDQQVAIVKTRLEMGALFGCPVHIAQQEAVKAVLKQTGEDISQFLLTAPAQDNIQDDEVMLEPTPLAHILGISAKAFNKRLEAAGFQTKVEGGWKPTVYGSPYCVQHSWSKDGKSGYNLKWKRTILDCLTPA